MKGSGFEVRADRKDGREGKDTVPVSRKRFSGTSHLSVTETRGREFTYEHFLFVGRDVTGLSDRK